MGQSSRAPKRREMDTMKPQDNAANINNANRGTRGTNRQYDQSQGNRGKQLAPTPNDANRRSVGVKKPKAPGTAA
jgi:hypothetical protein